MQKQIEWLLSDEATRLLEKMKAEWEAENREDEEKELYEAVGRDFHVCPSEDENAENNE
jgi:hypothetical protein